MTEVIVYDDESGSFAGGLPQEVGYQRTVTLPASVLEWGFNVLTVSGGGVSRWGFCDSGSTVNVNHPTGPFVELFDPQDNAWKGWSVMHSIGLGSGWTELNTNFHSEQVVSFRIRNFQQIPVAWNSFTLVFSDTCGQGGTPVGDVPAEVYCQIWMYGMTAAPSSRAGRGRSYGQVIG